MVRHDYTDAKWIMLGCMDCTRLIRAPYARGASLSLQCVSGVCVRMRVIAEMFRGSMHQDAHEFLNYLLDTAADTLRDYQRTLKKIQAKHKWQQQMQQQLKALKSAAAVQAIDGAATDSTLNGNNNKDTDDGASGDGSAALANGTVDLPATPGDGNDDDELHDDPEEPSSQPEMGDADDDDVVEVDFYENTVGGTFIHDVFEGQLVNEMKCFNCETISRYTSIEQFAGIHSRALLTVLVPQNRGDLLGPVSGCRTEHVALGMSQGLLWRRAVTWLQQVLL